MNALGRRIAQLIARQGPISVAEFMALALLDPQAGYYATREPFGAAGDFITAPEISQIFGELVGLWCVQAWLDQGRPGNARLVELGPGRGTLMADALRAAGRVPEFVADVDVELVEASPRLRAAQQARLADSGARLRWRARFESEARPLFLIANEFFDALPVRQYVMTERGWCERMVALDAQGALAFALKPAPLPAQDAAPRGGVREISQAALALAEEIGRSVSAHGGAALIVDYGYGEAGFGETLQAVGRHGFCDLLDRPGEHDLSAHVDFTSLARAASRAGAAVYGPVGQGAFLDRLGLAARAERLRRHNPGEADAIAAAVDRLAGPAQMGTLFKALAILPRAAPKPAGF